MSTVLTQNQFEELANSLIDLGAFEDAEDARTEYSGRGMYGQGCIGFVTDINLVSFGILLASAIAEANENNTTEDNWEFLDIDDFRGASTDSMGLGSIVYFPDIQVEK